MLNKEKILSRSDLHISRKLWHMTAGTSLTLLYAILPREIAIMLLAFSASLFIPIDILRHKIPKLNKVIIKLFKYIVRKNEIHDISALSWFLLGMFITIIIFPKNIAILALLFLSFGDPISALIGVKFGRHPFVSGKSIEGSMACFFTCTLIMNFFGYNPLIALCGGLIGMITEMIPSKIDDNFIIPVVSGLLLTILFMFSPVLF